MRSPLLVVLLSGMVGGVVGFAAAVATRSPPATYAPRAGRTYSEARGGPAARDEGALREVLAEIRTLVAAVRRDREAAKDTAVPEAGDGGAQPAHRAGGAGPVPEARWDLLEEMANRSRESGSFRPWLLLSEADVLERFGVPDRIATGTNSEIWTYLAPPGAARKKIVLRLSRGRLIGCLE